MLFIIYILSIYLSYQSKLSLTSLVLSKINVIDICINLVRTNVDRIDPCMYESTIYLYCDKPDN